MWVANSGDGTVSRVSAAANAVVGRPIPVGNVPVAIAPGRAACGWPTRATAPWSRINPADRHRDQAGGRSGPARRHRGRAARGLGRQRPDGTVTQIDPATGQPSGPISVGAGPAGIAVTPSAVWVANSLSLSVSKIDPVTGQVTATIPVGDGPSAIVATRDSVWVSDEFAATLDRIDPRAGQVAQSFLVGSSPHGLALTSAGVWVAARPFAAASHRGGTLTVVSNSLPAVTRARLRLMALPALATVYDGLVAFRRSPARRASRLVPDLAVPCRAHRRRHDLHLHAPPRYPLLQRHARAGVGLPPRHPAPAQLRRHPGYYEGILGAQACHQHPGRCDLSAGIVTNDAAGTVTFHLTQADPDFLYKLALLLATPAPPGAPAPRHRRAPFLPGTGPYMIARYRPNRR